MKYVIYGAGFRGKNFCDYIGTNDILAFIDLDKEKQGKEYCGRPVISLEEYLKMYDFCYIIVTPGYSNSIEDKLVEYNIYQTSNLFDMPVEFSGYGNCEFEDCYGGIKQNYSEPFYLYGLNAFGLLMYDYLSSNNKVFICPENGCNPKKIEWIKKYYPEIRLQEYTEINYNKTVFSTVGLIEEKFAGNIVDLFEYSNNNKYYWNASLIKFKNFYKEKKRCFIVATGPSLRIEDLKILRENRVFCFSVNSILKIASEWVADVFVVTDLYFIRNNIKDISDYDCKCKFILDSCQEYWVKDRDDSFKVHIVTSGPEKVGFSEEICQKIYSGYPRGGTVTYACLQLAVYMGFTEIYLLGADSDIVKGSKNNHFIEDEVEYNHEYCGMDLMIRAYEYAKEYADSHGIKIYNATRGGKLEVFERVDFDSLFE